MKQSDKPVVSVVISAYNEEKMLPACLSSVSWADEIVVIDNTSTDRTVSVAKKAGARVYTRPNYPMLNTNKNYGFTKARGTWILNLDADERVSPELKKEIDHITLNQSREKTSPLSSAVAGYVIPRKNIIFGKWIEHTGWYPDYQLRLFKRGSGSFQEQHVHEKIVVRGDVRALNAPLIHENYQTVSQFIEKLNRYTDNEAEHMIKSGYTFSYLDVIRMPKEELFRRYFSHEGYKDGLHGLVLSLLMALYHLVVCVKVWERQQFVDVPVHHDEVSSEVTKSYLEWIHWLKQTGHVHLSMVRRALIKLVSL